MKKYLLLFFAIAQGMALMAQTPQYKMKVTLNNGSKMVALTDDVDSLKLALLGKVQARLSERYTTSTSLGVNIDIEPNVSRVQAVCVPASETIDDVKSYIEANATVDSKTSYKKAFDFLQPETDYVVYALAYDTNGLPSEVSSLALKTGKEADDPFTVNVTNNGVTTLEYTVAPKDANVKFYEICTGTDFYEKWQNEEGNNGDIVQHFISMWSTFASWYGDTWQSLMKDDLKSGEYEDSGSHLMWDADQVIISFGMTDEGELATPIQVNKVHTNAPTPSDIQIGIEVTNNSWGDVEVKATPSNNDSYVVFLQPESYVSQFANDDDLLVGLCYKADNMDPATMARNKDDDWQEGVWSFRPRPTEDTPYYIIAFGLDEGAPATKPVIQKITVPGGSF